MRGFYSLTLLFLLLFFVSPRAFGGERVVMVGSSTSRNLRAFVVFSGDLTLGSESNYVTIGKGLFQVRAKLGHTKRLKRGDLEGVLYIEDISPPKREGSWSLEPIVSEKGGSFSSILSFLGFEPVGFLKMEDGYAFKTEKGEFFCSFYGSCRRKRVYGSRSFDLYMTKEFRVGGMDCMVLVSLDELYRAGGSYMMAVGFGGSFSIVKKGAGFFESLSSPPRIPLKALVLYGRRWF